LIEKRKQFLEGKTQIEDNEKQDIEGDLDESCDRKRARLEIPGSSLVGKIQESDDEMEVAGNFFNL
jgi:hypothetical protein